HGAGHRQVPAGRLPLYGDAPRPPRLESRPDRIQHVVPGLSLHRFAMKSRPLLFIAPGCIMLIAGFGLMLAAAVSGRLSSEAALPLPFGFTTAATGAMLLTRTPLAVFFLFIYAAAV